MKYFFPFAAIFVLHFNLSFVNATPKDSLSVVLYETSQKFIKGDSVYVDAIAIGQLENQDLIIVKKIKFLAFTEHTLMEKTFIVKI